MWHSAGRQTYGRQERQIGYSGRTPIRTAQGTAIANFINELGVYSGEYAPDFIAFDKFERDCFSPDALAHYAWNATCWFNYLGMVKHAAKALRKPAMLWQIPGVPYANRG